jgi:hypothetical protein
MALRFYLPHLDGGVPRSGEGAARRSRAEQARLLKLGQKTEKFGLFRLIQGLKRVG